MVKFVSANLCRGKKTTVKEWLSSMLFTVSLVFKEMVSLMDDWWQFVDGGSLSYGNYLTDFLILY